MTFLHQCCIAVTSIRHLAKCHNQSVMIMIPSGMAESDGGFLDTIVLIDLSRAHVTLNRLVDGFVRRISRRILPMFSPG